MTFNNFVAQTLHGVNVTDRIQRYSFENNWSNGEVVQRGTGSNYGQSGFLRPGFTYKELVNYVYAQAEEHQAIGALQEELLTRDWKVCHCRPGITGNLALDLAVHLTPTFSLCC